MDLFGELPGRRDHQGANAPFRRFVGQTVENRESESSGFSGAGLGQSQDVTAFHSYRYGQFLDGSRPGVSNGFDSGQHLGVKGKLLKIQRGRLLLDCFTEPSRSQVEFSAPWSRSIQCRGDAAWYWSGSL